jgi:pimeloyl-ACP methyl ester carboxylesterase/tetratricopeptide (TPR) repeat protein
VIIVAVRHGELSVTKVQHLKREDGETIAYLLRPGKTPGVVWCGGFKSDMSGTKATALDAWAARNNRSYLRFDYFGHGASSGNFREGIISRWRDDVIAVLDQLCPEPQVLVGSSMGGWLALLVAQARPELVSGLLLIAPAADFTEELMWAEMPEDVRQQILEHGEWERPSIYGEDAYPITRALIEDGRNNLVLGERIALRCPVRILQGMQDPDVPWQHAMTLVERLEDDPVITLIKQGDHRLSKPHELKLIEEALDGRIAGLEGSVMRTPVLAVLLLAAASTAQAAAPAPFAGNPTYTDCVAQSEKMPQEAFERARSWRDAGGGLPAQHCMALAMLGLGHPVEAAVQIDAVARKTEAGSLAQRAELLDQAGNTWLLAKQPHAAEDAFSEALKLSPQDSTLWADRARARALVTDWAGAEADLNAAIAFEQKDPELYVLRSSARRALGKVPEANADVQAALALNPDYPDALIERGVMKLAAGDRNGARADWIRVLAKSPQSTAAESARVHIENLDVNPDK